MTIWEQIADRLARYQRRNKDLSTRVAQLEASRDEWKAKAISRGEHARRAVGEARRQRERAELWKYRALQRPYECHIDESGGVRDRSTAH